MTILWLFARYKWLRVRFRLWTAWALFCMWRATKAATRAESPHCLACKMCRAEEIHIWQRWFTSARAAGVRANRVLDLLEHGTNRANRRAVAAVRKGTGL